MQTSRATLLLISALLSPVVLADADALLEQVRQNYTRHGAAVARALAAGHGMLVREERGIPMVPVIVDRSLAERAGFAAKLAPAGARIDALSRDYCRILVPMPRLDKLISAFPAERLRSPIPAHPAFGVGPIVSQSVPLTAADGYQVGNLDGTGVKVAVVDLGFAQLSNALSQGELPAGACDATHSVDYTGTGLQATTKHGTGVAEHVADMAPGVELYCLKVGDQVGLQNAADYLAAHNIRIANHSVAWVIASYYDDTGPINSIINNSFDTDGVFWAVSSGNAAHQHWRGTWTDTDGDGKLEFAANDELLALSGSAATVTVFLNWNQYGVGNKADLKLSVEDVNGNVTCRKQQCIPAVQPIPPRPSVSPPTPVTPPYSIVVEHRQQQRQRKRPGHHAVQFRPQLRIPGCRGQYHGSRERARCIRRGRGQPVRLDTGKPVAGKLFQPGPKYRWSAKTATGCP